MSPSSPQPARQPSTERLPQGSVPFDQINEPGCYICNRSGHLLRVPANAIAPGSPPLLDPAGDASVYVTKISDNPFVPKTKARLLAAEQDLDVNL